jgi:hypothetical protein
MEYSSRLIAATAGAALLVMLCPDSRAFPPASAPASVPAQRPISPIDVKDLPIIAPPPKPDPGGKVDAKTLQDCKVYRQRTGKEHPACKSLSY